MRKSTTMVTGPLIAVLVFAAPVFAGTQAGGQDDPAKEPECVAAAQRDGAAPADTPVQAEAAAPGNLTQAAPESQAQAAPADTAAPEVRTLLARAEAVYDALESMRAQFHQIVEVPLLEKRREMEGVWYQKGRGQFKMDFTDPPDDVIVSDGDVLWLFYPSTNPDQVIRTDLGESGTGAEMVDLQGRIFDQAHENYEAVYVGRELVSGEPAWQVRLTPIGESPYREVRVWVDTDNHLVRRFQFTEANGTVKTVTLFEHEPGASIPNSVFEFEPPPGTDVFAG